MMLTENDTCGTCKNRGLVTCSVSKHMTKLNEYGDCYYCEGERESPESVTCPDCQDA